MVKRRSVVTGWDPTYENPDNSTGRPKGVQTAADMRVATTYDVLAEGIFALKGIPSIVGSPVNTIQITPFQAAILSPKGGYYIVSITENESLTLNLANTGALKIYVQQKDWEIANDLAAADSEVTLGAVYGATAIPAGALLLFTATLSGQTSTSGITFTPAFKYTGQASGAIRVPTVASLADVAVIQTGMRALVTTGGSTGEYFYNGTVWQITTTASPAIDSLLTTGWISITESWSYTSWDSTTRIGVIAVPAGATTRFSAGQRVKFTQATGGVKMGIIHAVGGTSLTVFFPLGTTFNNQALTAVAWSPVKSPFGFDTSKDLWTLKQTLAAIAVQNSPTALVWYNAMSLAIGIGKWDVDYEATQWIVRGGAPVCWGFMTLSTAANTSSDSEMGSMTYSGNTTEQMSTNKRGKTMTFASPQTMYLNHAVNQAGNTQTAVYSSSAANTSAIIRAVSTYL